MISYSNTEYQSTITMSSTTISTSNTTNSNQGIVEASNMAERASNPIPNTLVPSVSITGKRKASIEISDSATKKQTIESANHAHQTQATKTEKMPTTATTSTEIFAVIAFNDKNATIYNDPDAVSGDILLVDISGSISGQNALLLRTAVAAMTKGTKSHGEFIIPKPEGGTAIIAAVKLALKISQSKGTIYLFTDGAENCWKGPLLVGREEDGSEKVLDVSFFGSVDDVTGTPSILADYLQESGVKVCILGIGVAAAPMVAHMIGRKNVYCAHVAHGADTRTVVSTVRTLRHLSNGGSCSVTRNGKQHVLITCLSEDVQEAIQQMTSAEMAEYDAAVGSTVISGSVIVTAGDLKARMESVFTAYDELIPDEQVKPIKSALLLFLESACDGEMPGALITSKHSAIIGVPNLWKPFRRHCNRLLSRLVGTDVLNRAKAVPEGGKCVVENGNKHTYSAGCCQYDCLVVKKIVANLAEDSDYCTPRAELPAHISKLI